MNYAEHTDAVVASLSAILAATRARYESERTGPSFDSDKSDDFIKEMGKRIEVLKRLRDEFEAEMARCV